MTAAVTGGTGFLGGALVEMLLCRGSRVRVLHRRPEDEVRIRSWGAEPVRGDLCVSNGCDGLVSEGDVVFHSAARVDMVGSWRQFRETTIEGTRHLLEAALPRRPGRFVYISSAAVYSPQAAGQPISAGRTPTRPAHYNFYGRAKLEAEALVRRRCRQAGCPWTIVRLGFMYGPRNQALFRHFVPMARRNELFIVGDGQNRIATLYLDDAARAVLLAGTHPAAFGRIYDVAADERVTQRTFLDATCDALGLPRTRRQVRSVTMAHLLATMEDCFARLAGRLPMASRAMVALMAADQIVDASLARKELGWSPQVGFEQGIRRMGEWYRQERGLAVTAS
ncbi:MAG: NAD(P)-dependent oxidoreductase [Phycisphaerae bacterium]|nr:NAD(P)-dependent oxidoreductase [Phycisphaerae bacterium]